MARDFRLGKAGNRIYFIDELRGFAVLCMVFFHGFYTFGYLFNYKPALDALEFFTPAQPFFAALFIFISGISTKLSSSNIKRGLKLLVVAVLLSCVTIIVFPMFSLNGCEIYFGILHLLALSILLYAACSRLLCKIPPVLGIIIFLMLFFFTYRVPQGYLGVDGVGMNLPSSLYGTNFLFFLGFPSSTFFSADYFPILPWTFMFLAGSYMGVWAAKGRFPQFCYKPCIVPLGWLGRHALLVYLLHQPLIYALAWLIQYAVNLF